MECIDDHLEFCRLFDPESKENDYLNRVSDEIKENEEIVDDIEECINNIENKNIIRKMRNLINYTIKNKSNILLEKYKNKLKDLVTNNVEKNILKIIVLIRPIIILWDEIDEKLMENSEILIDKDEILELDWSNIFIIGLMNFIIKSKLLKNDIPFDVYIDRLSMNLMSSSRIVRILTLNILAYYEDKSRYEYFNELLNIELIIPNFNNYRYRISKLVDFMNSLYKSYLSKSKSVEIFVYFLTSHFSINLSIIYKDINECIKNVYNSNESNNIWEYLLKKSYDKLLQYYNGEEEKEVFIEEILYDGNRNLIGNNINMYRYIQKLSINFNDSTYVYTQISKFYHILYNCNTSNNNIYIIKEMIINLCYSLKNIHNIHTIVGLYDLLISLLSLTYKEVSIASIDILYKYHNNLNIDLIKSLYDCNYIQLRKKISQLSYSIINYEEYYIDIIIRIIFNIILTKSDFDIYCKLYNDLFMNKNIHNSSNIDKLLHFLLSYINSTNIKYLNILSCIFIHLFKIILPDIQYKIALILHGYFSILKQILNDEFNRFHIKSRQKLKKYTLKIICVLFSGINDLDEYLVSIEFILIPILVKNKTKIQIVSSVFPQIVYNIVLSKNYYILFTINYDDKSLIYLLLDCLDLDNIPTSKCVLIFNIFVKLSSQLINSSSNLISNDDITFIYHRIVYSMKKYMVLLIEKNIIYDMVRNIEILIKNGNLLNNDNGIIIDLIDYIVSIKMKKKYTITNIVIALLNISSDINNELLLKLISFQYKLYSDKERIEIYKVLNNKNIIDNEVFSILENLSSYIDSDENSINHELRSDTLKNIDINSCDSDIIKYFIINASIKCFEKCCSNYIVHISMNIFIDNISKCYISIINIYQNKIQCDFYEVIKKLLLSKNEPILSGVVVVFHNIVIKKLVKNYVVFELLCTNNFFNNIFNIQIHERVNTLILFKDYVNQLDTKCIVLCVIPILLFIIDNEEYCNSEKYHNLINEASIILGLCCKYLSWNNYHRIVQHFIQDTNFLYDYHLKKHKIRTRVLTLIFDNFSFNIDDDSISSENKGADGESKVMRMVKREEVNKLIEKLNEKFYKKTIIDENRHLFGKFSDINEQNIRLSIGLIIIHLIKKIEKINDKNLYVNGIIYELISLLCNKHKDIRVMSLSILIKCIQNIHPSYLVLCVREIKKTLNKGYLIYVCIHSINSILVKLNDTYSNEINECIDILIELIILEQFGQLYEERNNDNIKRSKNIDLYKKSEKAFSLCEIIGKYIKDEQLYKLIGSFNDISLKINTYKILKIVEKCYNYYLKGILKNEILSQQSLFIFSHVLIRDSTLFSNQVNNQHVKQYKFKVIPSRLNSLLSSTSTSDLNIQTNYLVVCFGLKLFYSLINEKNHNHSPSPTIFMIRPTIKLVLLCLQCPYIDIISKSLYCFKVLLQKIDSINDIFNEIQPQELISIIYVYLKDMVDCSRSSNEDILVTTKLLINILKKVQNNIQLDTSISGYLVLFCEKYIISGTNKNCFKLLNLIVKLSPNHNIIHNVMINIRFNSITHQDENIRLNCSKCIVFYLKKYHKTQLCNYIQFCLSNYDAQLSVYCRISSLKLTSLILELLVNVLVKNESYKVYVNNVYIHLVEIITNENDSGVFKESINCCKICIKNYVNHHKDFIDILLSWLITPKIELLETSTYIVEIFIDVSSNSLNYKDILKYMIKHTKFIYNCIVEQKSLQINVSIVLYRLVYILGHINRYAQYNYNEYTNEIFQLLLNILSIESIFWRIKLQCLLVINTYYSIIKLSSTDHANNIWLPSTVDDINNIINNSIQIACAEKINENDHEIGVKTLIIITRIINVYSSNYSLSITLEDILDKLIKYANNEYQKKSNRIYARYTLLKYISGVIVLSDIKGNIKEDKIVLSYKALQKMFYYINRDYNNKCKNDSLSKLAENTLEIVKKCISPKLYLKLIYQYNHYSDNIKLSRKHKSAVLKCKNSASFQRSRFRRRFVRNIRDLRGM